MADKCSGGSRRHEYAALTKGLHAPRRIGSVALAGDRRTQPTACRLCSPINPQRDPLMKIFRSFLAATLGLTALSAMPQTVDGLDP